MEVHEAPPAVDGREVDVLFFVTAPPEMRDKGMVLVLNHADWITPTDRLEMHISIGAPPRRTDTWTSVPGGPRINKLWPPAAAINNARFALSCPMTSSKSMW